MKNYPVCECTDSSCYVKIGLKVQYRSHLTHFVERKVSDDATQIIFLPLDFYFRIFYLFKTRTFLCFFIHCSEKKVAICFILNNTLNAFSTFSTSFIPDEIKNYFIFVYIYIQTRKIKNYTIKF